MGSPVNLIPKKILIFRCLRLTWLCFYFWKLHKQKTSRSIFFLHSNILKSCFVSDQATKIFQFYGGNTVELRLCMPLSARAIIYVSVTLVSYYIRIFFLFVCLFLFSNYYARTRWHAEGLGHPKLKCLPSFSCVSPGIKGTDTQNLICFSSGESERQHMASQLQYGENLPGPSPSLNTGIPLYDMLEGKRSTHTDCQKYKVNLIHLTMEIIEWFRRSCQLH